MLTQGPNNLSVGYPKETNLLFFNLGYHAWIDPRCVKEQRYFYLNVLGILRQVHIKKSSYLHWNTNLSNRSADISKAHGLETRLMDKQSFSTETKKGILFKYCVSMNSPKWSVAPGELTVVGIVRSFGNNYRLTFEWFFFGKIFDVYDTTLEWADEVQGR